VTFIRTLLSGVIAAAILTACGPTAIKPSGPPSYTPPTLPPQTPSGAICEATAQVVSPCNHGASR